MRVFAEPNQSGDGRFASEADDTSAPQELGVIGDARQPTIGRARRGEEVADSVGFEVGLGSASHCNLIASWARSIRDETFDLKLRQRVVAVGETEVRLTAALHEARLGRSRQLAYAGHNESISSRGLVPDQPVKPSVVSVGEIDVEPIGHNGNLSSSITV